MKAISRGWTFRRIGGVDQVRFRSGEDIAHLSELDQTLWAVLAMPTDQPELKECLAVLDADGDGKVRVPDILRTIGYLSDTLRTLDLLFENTGSILPDQLRIPPLRDAIERAVMMRERESPAGSARPENRPFDTVMADTAIRAFSSLPFNGDGVVVPASAEDEETCELIEHMIAAGFSADDQSGTKGVGRKELERFNAAVASRLEWEAAGISGNFSGADSAALASAYALYGPLKAQIDEYFRRCQVMAMSDNEETGTELLKVITAVISRRLSPDDPELARLPIAMPVREEILDPRRALHPAYREGLLEFFSLLRASGDGPMSLAFSEWKTLSARLEAYGLWRSGEPEGEAVAAIPGEAQEKLISLIEKDESMGDYAKALDEVKTLLILKRDFLRVLGNFVNFEDFYVDKRGLFRTGTLYLDGRELSLCLDVRNPAAHAIMAGLSSMYLIYCGLSRKDGSRKNIVAALTAGDADNIFAGRNGVFYDKDGNNWDAVITKVVIQPISIREAFFSPYKWFARTLEELAMKRAARAEASSLDAMKSTAVAASEADKLAAKPEALPLPKKMDVGTVAAIGVALGSIGAMVTGILGIFLGMGVWMPLGFAGIFILISGPSMILAYMKLRKRNIGPILNAEGWAVNGRLKINVPFGATLSRLGVLPPGSSRQLHDPFEKKRLPYFWLGLAILAAGFLVLAYFLGWLGFLPFLARG